jgi:hypothetical protein
VVPLRRIVPYREDDTDADGKPLLQVRTANGDIISHLAERYPSINLMYRSTCRNRPTETLATKSSVRQGYALDILRPERDADRIGLRKLVCACVLKELTRLRSPVRGA